jgi:hypothetical protein
VHSKKTRRSKLVFKGDKEMKIHKLYIAIGLMLALGLFFELAAHASELNQQTKITFSAPVQIPGQILPAGTYTFEQAEPDDNPNIIQIFNGDGTQLVATLETIPTERLEPAEDTSVTLANAGPVSPDYLVNWFYPDRLIGHRFVYSKQQEQEIAQAPKQTLVANQPTSKLVAAVE